MNNPALLSFLARRSKCLLPATALLALAGCSQQTVTVQLHPLQQSGDVSYVCRVAPGMPDAGAGVPLSECNLRSIGRGERDLNALVTQTGTGEVALINVPYDITSQAGDEGVIDVDDATPGYGFLPIGARPGDIVSTPGGAASFVGVGESGKPGIFALPTEWLSAPADGEPPLDITTWPACSLPAVPGSIAMIVEPPAADGTVFTSCEHTTAEERLDRTKPVERKGPADVDNTDWRRGLLPREGGLPGRRKLLVSLPDLGQIAVIDAQALLERGQGSFGECELERTLELDFTLPAVLEPQVLPDDLVGSCDNPFAPPQPPAKAPTQATPTGFALADDDTLYVADATVPKVHAIDVSDPCALTETTPLYTRSLENAARTVTTSRVAVSPLTPSGKRFVYAIDQFDWPTPSMMAFDVSPGSTERTPIVRPGAAFLPSEPADRIQFLGSPRDVSFVLRDRPEVDNTGSTVIGASCDPDPASTGPGTLYRTSADYSSGARAGELRGVFASVLLTDGQVTFVDVEDFDAPCRRPAVTNPSAEEDFRGCKGDPANIPFYATSSGPTVTNEVSCRMVEPHRARAASLGITSSALGIRAPSLRTFPQLRSPDTAPQGTAVQRPKLLAVDFPGVASGDPVPAMVYVGSTLYTRSADNATSDALVIDPSIAERHSLTLPFNEPRAYAAANDLSLTYEGVIAGGLTGGFLVKPDFDRPPPGLTLGRLLLKDPTVRYCDSGVNDAALMTDVGKKLGVADEVGFASSHADFVVLTADFPTETDGYWRDAPLTRSECEAKFGRYDEKRLLATREFSIVDAQQQVLSLTPRSTSVADEVEQLVSAALACFPGGAAYQIRAADQWILQGSASGFRHDIVAAWRKDGASDYLECVRDCNPQKKYFDSRVFEISSGQNANGFCKAEASTGVTLQEAAAACIHATPTERFAVYRGEAASYRDMTFSWQTIGGFSNLRIDLRGVSPTVSPQALVALPEFNWLSVIDATSLGLALVSLDSLAPLTPTIY